MELVYKAATRPMEGYAVREANDISRLLRHLASHPSLRAVQACSERSAILAHTSQVPSAVPTRMPLLPFASSEGGPLQVRRMLFTIAIQNREAVLDWMSLLPLLCAPTMVLLTKAACPSCMQQSHTTAHTGDGCAAGRCAAQPARQPSRLPGAGPPQTSPVLRAAV